MKSRSGSAKSEVLQYAIGRLTTCFRSLQRQGINLGSVSKQGNVFLGFLRLIHRHGPMTVPQIAQQRRVSRQRIQVMVDEYAYDGYLEFTPNPSHKRSKLVNLTQKGSAEYSKLSEIIIRNVEQAAHNFENDELQTTVNVLEKLQDLIEQSNHYS